MLIRIFTSEENMNHTALKLAIAIAATVTSMSAALSSRTWVSTTGSDNVVSTWANASLMCGATNPCRTFQRAIQYTAAGGEVDVLTAGDYGSFTITKAITIDGGNLAYVQTTTNGAAITVTAGVADSVVIRNLSIDLPMNTPLATATLGISWTQGFALYLEDLSIFGGSTGVWANSTQSGNGGPYAYLQNVTIRASCLGAVFLSGSSSLSMKAALDRVTVEQSAGEGATLANGRFAIARSSFAFAGAHGVLCGSNCQLSISDSTVVNSNIGLTASSGSTIRVSNTTISGNTSALLPNGGGSILSFGNNAVAGNVNQETFSGAVPLK
jgi:hypothetical protein